MSAPSLSLQNHFLIAMPALADFNFNQAVVYVCAHNEEGAMGIIVNRPLLNVKLGEVLSQLDIESDKSVIVDRVVYLGGPVQPERGFIIHPVGEMWQTTLEVSDKVAVTSSQDILIALVQGEGPKDFLMALGYAGWAPGQLEIEVANNFWLTVPADPQILFEVPYHDRWRVAASSLGVDVSDLSSDVGHG